MSSVAAVLQASQELVRGRRMRTLLLAASVLTVLTLLLPMLTAPSAPLTSDESLYLSEAYNVANGTGPRYSSQEFIHHRPPLYPALLAVPIRLSGGDHTAAYVVPKLVVIALVAATFLLARQAFGNVAGLLAAVLVTSNAFFRWLGTTLFLDGLETLFLLLLLVTLIEGFRRASAAWFAAAGMLLAVAFLTKEAAGLWLPLPVLFALLSTEHRNPRIALGLTAYVAAVAVPLSAWWLWVYLVTDRVYFWGEPDTRLLVLATVLTAAAALSIFAVLFSPSAPRQTQVPMRWAGAAFLCAWCVGALAFLEITSWPFPADYWNTVPRYLWNVAAPNTQPWPLLVLGLAWLAWRSLRGDEARLIVLAIALFAPFALWSANRWFAYRDVLPMAYLAYVGAAGVGASLLQRGKSNAPMLSIVAVASALLFGLFQTVDLLENRLPFERAAVTQENWDNKLVRDSAAWLRQHVPAGEGVMTSRLYFSHLYVLDAASHPIYQLPTVRVEPAAGPTPSLRAVTTLFRWEDHRTANSSGQVDWLYLHRYPEKQYYIALSEQDLLRELRDRSVSHLMLTGEDAGFSSFSYLDYFIGHPAFELIHTDVRDEANAVYVFRIHRERLAARRYKAVVTPEAWAALERDLGALSAGELRSLIDRDGIVVRRASEKGG